MLSKDEIAKKLQAKLNVNPREGEPDEDISQLEFNQIEEQPGAAEPGMGFEQIEGQPAAVFRNVKPLSVAEKTITPVSSIESSRPEGVPDLNASAAAINAYH